MVRAAEQQSGNPSANLNTVRAEEFFLGVRVRFSGVRNVISLIFINAGFHF